MEPSPVITYDATVVTGLEKLAISEAEKKISVSEPITNLVGHIFIRTKDRYGVLSKLHSVDNIYVVVLEEKEINLTEAGKDEVIQRFTQVIEKCDWKLGLQVWLEASGFNNCDLATILESVPNQLKPSFRVSCNRTGTHKLFTSQDFASFFGGAVNDLFHWPVSLKEFDFEILLTMKEKTLRVSLCLSKKSLFKRYIVSYGVTTLRGTIAYNLIQIADIQPGDLVCDPLCGSGVIPIEAEIGWPTSYILAGDNHAIPIEKTLANVRWNQLTRTNILQMDSTRMPFKDNLIDVFVTDLPFGKRIGSKHQNRTLYPALLSEMLRCSKVGTGRIVLLTQDKSTANRCLNSEEVKKYCRLDRSYFVKVGGLDSSIYLLKRNKAFYCKE